MKKNIKNYENYEIYENGDVFNLSTNKLLKGSVGEHGYKYYRLSKNNSKKMFYAHRLVAEHFLENPNNYPIVNHIDGDKLNNMVDNLEWTTYSENTRKWHERKEKTEPKKVQKYSGDLENELWKNIPGFNYRVSNLGRVHNLKTNNLLRPTVTCGYYKVTMSQNGKTVDVMIHDLVYMLFSDDTVIDKTIFVVDHIDGDKLNNSYTNLRKMSKSENVKAAFYEQKLNKSIRPINQYDLDGNFIASFNSIKEASRALKLDSSSITKVCRGKVNTCGGFIFKYKQ